MLALASCPRARRRSARARGLRRPARDEPRLRPRRPGGEGVFALDGLALEGPWPGRPDRRLDDSGLGKYRFEVRDGRRPSALLARASRASTASGRAPREAKTLARAFHESLRFPVPAGPGARRVPEARGGRGVPGGLVRPRRPGLPLVDRAPAAGGRARVGRGRERRARATRWTSCCWATATPRPRWTSGTATRSGWPSCCSRCRRSRSAARTSTSGRSTRRPTSPASPALPTASTAARPSARPTTPSAPSATC